MKGSSISYSQDELDWIKAHSTMPRADMQPLFNAKFNREISVQNLHALCKRRGWKTGRTGHFTPGQIPYNAGQPMPAHVREKCLKTAFKKGNMPHNAKGAGHERICKKDGYIVMIVDEVNPWTGAATRPVHKHRYLWEKENGPVPEGHVLKCLDGNKLNTDPSNWEAIPQAVNSRLNSRWRLRYGAVSDELKPTVMLLAKVEHAAKEAMK